MQVNVGLAQGTRVEVTEPGRLRVERAIRGYVPEATRIIVQAWRRQSAAEA